ncbi:AAA family ATPase [Phytomonospora sp. NPDC050363]|uniref:AAA family ATPase n=1 Tax=Phytomonospora sp. NPDC050363 TaxID=3155642 RepID=UPI0033EB9308
MTGLPMVGRAAQLAAVAAAWARVRGGAPETVVITGDDGVGKSRLAAEALAGMDPTAVLAGRARAVGPAPYDWLASALHGQPLDDLPAAPEALAWLTQRPSPHRFEPGALLRVAADVVRRRIGDGPGVLLVEDLHDLDPASLNLVADLAGARSLPALLLVTSRPTAGSAARVLTQLSSATRCHLGPLAPPEAAALLTAALGAAPPPGAVLRAHRRTGGNPRWLTELATAVKAGELAAVTDGPLPPYLAALATGHLDDGPDARVARVAALLGGRLGTGALADLCGDAAEPAVARLAASGVLVRTSTGEPRFACPLVAEALVQTSPASLRAEVHERAHARSVAAGDLDGQVRHGVHLGRPADAAPAVAAHLAAGRPRAALDLLDATGTLTPSLLRQATAAAHAIGDYPRAAAHARAWRDAAGDAAERVAAMRVQADLSAHLGRAAAQHRILGTIAPRIPSAERAAYLTSLGWAALCGDRPGEAVGWAAQALELTSGPDPAALTVLGHATALTGDTRRGIALLAAGRRYAAARRDLVAFGRAVAASAAIRLPGLSGEAARRVLDEHLTALARHGLTGRAGPVVAAAVAAATAAGETDRARALAEQRLPVETDPAERAVLTGYAGRLSAESDRERALVLRDRLAAEMIGMDLPRVLRASAALDLALADGAEAAEDALRAYVAAASPESHAADLAEAGRTALKAGVDEARVARLLPDGGAALGIDADAPGAELTAREREVLGCLTEGMTNQQVASRLGISIRTVTVHVSNLLRKTGSASRTEAALWAVHHGLADTGR